MTPENFKRSECTFKQKNNCTVSKCPVGRYALITSGIIITLLGENAKS